MTATMDAGADAPQSREPGRWLERALLAAIVLVEVVWIGGLIALAVRFL